MWDLNISQPYRPPLPFTGIILFYFLPPVEYTEKFDNCSIETRVTSANAAEIGGRLDFVGYNVSTLHITWLALYRFCQTLQCYSPGEHCVTVHCCETLDLTGAVYASHKHGAQEVNLKASEQTRYE
jgi:hypothetical protein